MHYPSITSVVVVVVIVVMLTNIQTHFIQQQQQQYQYSYFSCCVDSFTIQQQQYHQQKFRYYQSKLYSTTIVQTTIPPLFDSPVFSLATLCVNNDNDDGDVEDNVNDTDLNQQPKQRRKRKTNMNIITYATAVSFSPERIWVIGLYKSTMTYKNFKSTKFGILQVLCNTHIPIIPILGSCSGSFYDKQQLCSNTNNNNNNCTWIPSSTSLLLNNTSTTAGTDKDDDIESIMILPNCAYYIQLQCLNIIDAGGHDIAVCKVLSMHTSISASTMNNDDNNNNNNNSIDDNTISHAKPSNHLSTKMLRDLGIITEQGRVADVYRIDLLNEH